MAIDPGEETRAGSRTPGGTEVFFRYEEEEYRSQLKALDAEVAASLPNQRPDICYKSSATPVRNVFELPVPVDCAGAHVTYRFATDEYDVSFGIFFQGLDGKMETVLPSTRVDSHFEPISGDITVHRPGAVILLWDNSYSWFTTKTLSYSVNLKYPSGNIADKERIQRARKVLDAAYRDIEVTEQKQLKVNDLCKRLSGEVGQLEHKVAALTAELEEKRKELETTSDDQAVLEKTLANRRAHLLPLLMRSLSMRALVKVASFTGPKDQLYMVSKLWSQLYVQAKTEAPKSPPTAPAADGNIDTKASPSKVRFAAEPEAEQLAASE